MNRLLLLVFLAFVMPAQADVYRCVSADGSTTFSQTPCSGSAEKVAVDSKPTVKGSADCEFADKFVRSTSRLMRQNVDKGRLIKQFGGPEAFDDNATRIVNYVYQYEDSRSVTQDRIADLAMGQCQAGAFGSVSCETLPKAYTESGGGCDGTFSASHADYSVDVFAIHRDRAEERARESHERQRQQAEELSEHYAALQRGTECRDKIEAKIFRIETQIWAGADPNGHRLELKRLREQLSKCGPAHYREIPPPQPGGYHRIRKGIE